MALGALATSFSKLATDWAKRGSASASRFSVDQKVGQVVLGDRQVMKVFVGRRRVSQETG